MTNLINIFHLWVIMNIRNLEIETARSFAFSSVISARMLFATLKKRNILNKNGYNIKRGSKTSTDIRTVTKHTFFFIKPFFQYQNFPLSVKCVI